MEPSEIQLQLQQCTQRGQMVKYGTLRMVGRQAICKWSCSHRPTTNNNSIFKTNNEYPLKRRVGLGKVAAMHMLFEGDESVLSYDQQSNSGQACLHQHTGWNSGEVHGRTQAGNEGASASTTTSINITRGESWGTKAACDVAGWTHFHSNTTPTYARPPPDLLPRPHAQPHETFKIWRTSIWRVMATPRFLAALLVSFVIFVVSFFL